MGLPPNTSPADVNTLRKQHIPHGRPAQTPTVMLPKPALFAFSGIHIFLKLVLSPCIRSVSSRKLWQSVVGAAVVTLSVQHKVTSTHTHAHTHVYTCLCWQKHTHFSNIYKTCMIYETCMIQPVSRQGVFNCEFLQIGLILFLYYGFLWLSCSVCII